MAAEECARDLEADLAICEAATPGPYRTWRCECGSPVCDQVFISVTNSDGRLNPEDARFYAEARDGWPYAIRRAMKAEEEIDRLHNEIGILQEQLSQSGRCWD